MLIDSNIRDQAYQFFIQESMEFLQMLEEGLLNLQQEHDTPHIHAIMRAAHSIKGGAASVGLEAIKKIAHQMEDVLRALYKDSVVIDAALEELLLHAYDCLRTPLIQQIQTGENEGEKWLAQSEIIFEQLVEKLGDAMLGESELPTAAELGIDIVQVIFSSDVENGLQRLESVLADASHPEIAGELRAQAQVFLGMGELVNLPGFVAIAQAAELAIETHPDQARSITQVAMEDFRIAQQLVLAGDRGRGGEPSAALLAWVQAAPGEVVGGAIDSRNDSRNDSGNRATNPAADVAAVFATMAVDRPSATDTPQFATAPDARLNQVLADQNFWAAAIGQDDEDDDSFAFDVFDHLSIDPVDEDSFIDVADSQAAADTSADRLNAPQYLPDASLQSISFDLSDVDDDISDMFSSMGGTVEFDRFVVVESAGLDAEMTEAAPEADLPEADLPEADSFLDVTRLTDTIAPLAAELPSMDPSMRSIVQAETMVESWPDRSDLVAPLLELDDMVIDSTVESTLTSDAVPEAPFTLADTGFDFDFDADDDVDNFGAIADLAMDLDPPIDQFANPLTSSIAADTDYSGLSDMMMDLDGGDDGADDAAADWPETFTLAEAAAVVAPEPSIAADRPAATTAPAVVSAPPTPRPPVERTPAQPFPTRPQIPLEVAQQATVSIDLKQAPAVPVKPQADKSAVAADAPMLSNAIRVDLDRLDRLNNLVGEMVSQENSSILQNQQLMEILTTMLQRVGRFDHLTRELRTYLDGSQTARSHMPQTSSTTAIAQQSSLASEFDPLQMDNYSDLSVVMQETIDEIAQIGEAMRDMTLLTRNAQQTQRHKQQTLREVRTDLLWARMLPIGDILQRFPRMIRDMSRKHGKSIAVKLSGSTTLVDKSMLERLYDPLVHLVRNAFDHGIEPIEQRAELGKSAEATIDIRAYHRGSQIYIEVQDDGRGIDVDRVLKKALSKGIVTPEAAAKLEQEEIYELLFAPGFSTVDIISELSGRGVGLDTVRSQIKLLKGSLSITSEMGKGTTFTMRLPLTLTITKLLVFSIGGRLMSVPVDSLRAIVAAPVDQIQTLKNGQFYHWQEQFIPIYPQSIFSKHYALTHQLQEQPNALTLPTKGKVPLLMLAGENQTIALPVETILYERELAIKPFSNAVTPPPYLYGCTLLGDGSLVPVLDAQILISAKQSEIVTRRVDLVPPPPVVDRNNATILVIDDSLTTRQTLAAVLQKAGYRVLQAKDGREGIEQLAQHAEIQAVFCDIEMPRMNGFEFLNSCRQEYAKEILPVTMLSSRSNEKHRQVARYMGANEYLTKPFLEPELLEVLGNLLLLRAQAITAELPNALQPALV
jgi:two-component system, chemotaxis family, sensor histidine kinase and response regulator PixL